IPFRLRAKPGKEEEDDQAYREGWPDLLRKLKQVGISNYSIFRRNQALFLVMEVDDFEGASKELHQDPTNEKRQEYMSPLVVVVRDLAPGERFAMMREVFYLK